MSNPLRLLSKLRRFPDDGDPAQYLSTEYRQNLKAIEDAFRRLGVTLNTGATEPAAPQSTLLTFANSQTFLSSGSWKCPEGVTQVRIDGCGGGSGGAGNAGADANGGRGAIFCSVVFVVTPGFTYSISIGSGGSPGSPTGGAGGDTTFGTSLAPLVTLPGATSSSGYASNSPFYTVGSTGNSGGLNSFGSGAGPYSNGLNGQSGANNVTGISAPNNSGAGGGAATAYIAVATGGSGGSGRLIINW
jgi:hypothetical protein